MLEALIATFSIMALVSYLERLQDAKKRERAQRAINQYLNLIDREPIEPGG